MVKIDAGRVLNDDGTPYQWETQGKQDGHSKKLICQGKLLKKVTNVKSKARLGTRLYRDRTGDGPPGR